MLQLREPDVARAEAILARHGLATLSRRIGCASAGRRVSISANGKPLIDLDRVALRSLWSETTWRMQRLRDDPACADEERDARLDEDDPGLAWRLTFDPDEDIAAPFIARGARPRVAVLREQGVNSQVEMAAAFDRAGFAAVDVHMTDLIDRGATLEGFQGLVACGGFSYGDVLGAGEGWAKSILFNARARALFAAWFAQAETLHARRVQWLPDARGARRAHPGHGALAALSPQPLGAVRGPAVAGRGRGDELAVLHGHGGLRAPDRRGARGGARGVCECRRRGRRGRAGGAALRGQSRARRNRYPANPNGSPQGIAGLTSADGRVTILMPHPERVFRTVQNSWHPASAGEDSGWMRIFRNARAWVG